MEEHEEPILEKDWLSSSVINDSNIDDTTFENAIRFSVSTTQSPAASKKLKERPQLPFSVAAFDESMESTADTAPLKSTLNESLYPLFFSILKEQCASWLFWMKYSEKKFNSQLFYLPIVSPTFVLSCATRCCLPS